MERVKKGMRERYKEGKDNFLIPFIIIEPHTILHAPQEKPIQKRILIGKWSAGTEHDRTRITNSYSHNQKNPSVDQQIAIDT